jgi:hypothetical protein
MKDEIFQLIRTDKVLRRKLADALNVDTNTIYRQAACKSAHLTRPLVVEFIAKQIGKTPKEIIA